MSLVHFDEINEICGGMEFEELEFIRINRNIGDFEDRCRLLKDEAIYMIRFSNPVEVPTRVRMEEMQC